MCAKGIIISDSIDYNLWNAFPSLESIAIVGDCKINLCKAKEILVFGNTNKT
jgi:hypothetical protein